MFQDTCTSDPDSVLQLQCTGSFQHGRLPWIPSPAHPRRFLLSAAQPQRWQSSLTLALRGLSCPQKSLGWHWQQFGLPQSIAGDGDGHNSVPEPNPLLNLPQRCVAVARLQIPVWGPGIQHNGGRIHCQGMLLKDCDCKFKWCLQQRTACVSFPESNLTIQSC